MKALIAFIALLPALCPASDDRDWIVPYRIAYFADALQTYSIMGRDDGYHETNPLYKGMGNFEAAASVIIVNWAIERAISGIRDRKLRRFLGGVAASVEIAIAGNNFRIGINLIRT
jgi:hypothetical protein